MIISIYSCIESYRIVSYNFLRYRIAGYEHRDIVSNRDEPSNLHPYYIDLEKKVREKNIFLLSWKHVLV